MTVSVEREYIEGWAPPGGWGNSNGDGDYAWATVDEAVPFDAEATPPETDGSPDKHEARLQTGAEFILDQRTDVAAIWGNGDRVAQAAGETVLLVGPQGVGKSTLAQRVTLARIGLCRNVLGLPVAQGQGRTLYLALDRPRQIARSFHRMVDDNSRDILHDNLRVWCGQLPVDLIKDPSLLLELCRTNEADTVVIDSLKDINPQLSKEEIGGAINQAMQIAVSNGVEVIAVHHQRKAQGDNKKPTTLADVYGSTWLTAGAGSVILLWGEPGDVLVELTHLKQPAEELGPWTLSHNHQLGSITLHEPAELTEIIARAHAGVTAQSAAAALFSAPTPTKNQVEKARRKLEKLVADGIVEKVEPDTPSDPMLYRERERA